LRPVNFASKASSSNLSESSFSPPSDTFCSSSSSPPPKVERAVEASLVLSPASEESDSSIDDRILVLARVRPLTIDEKNDEEAGQVVVYTKEAAEESSTLQSLFKRCIIGVNLEALSSSHKNEKEYKLDGVFSPEASQDDIFTATVPLLRAGLSGYNVTIFTYGQTGTGKTHTMLGHDLWALASEVDQAATGEISQVRPCEQR